MWQAEEEAGGTARTERSNVQVVWAGVAMDTLARPQEEDSPSLEHPTREVAGVVGTITEVLVMVALAWPSSASQGSACVQREPTPTWTGVPAAPLGCTGPALA